MLTNTPRDTAERVDPPSEMAAHPLFDVGWRAVGLASRACCCSSRLAVIVVMPPSPARPHSTELLLCGHHYRRSRSTLAAAGATVMDPSERPVSPQREIWVGLPA